MEYIRDGTAHKVMARKEVVLSAGAVNSAQILMLSGIGQRGHLEKFGVQNPIFFSDWSVYLLINVNSNNQISVFCNPGKNQRTTFFESFCPLVAVPVVVVVPSRSPPLTATASWVTISLVSFVCSWLVQVVQRGRRINDGCRLSLICHLNS